MTLMLDPGTLTTTMMGAYAVINNPVVKSLLSHAAESAATEAGKQTLLLGAQSLNRQISRVVTGVKAMFGPHAAKQLESLQTVPEQHQDTIDALSQEIKTPSEPISETDLANLLEEIKTLQEETHKLSSQIEEYRSNSVVTHGSFSPVTTGSHSPITIGNSNQIGSKRPTE